MADPSPKSFGWFLWKLLLIVFLLEVASVGITIIVMAVYNWFIPVDWEGHIDDVENLFFGIQVVVILWVLFLSKPSKESSDGSPT